MAFEKSVDRVKWLKKGMSIVNIEQIYLETNGFKVVRGNVLWDTNLLKKIA